MFGKGENKMKAVDNSGKEYELVCRGNVCAIEKEKVPRGLEYIDVLCEEFSAEAGEEGYYVIANWDRKGSRLVRFDSQRCGERIFEQKLMPIFGVKKADKCVLVIAEGYKYDFDVVVGAKCGKYYIYPRFYLYGEQPFDDICLRVIELDKTADYSDMAVSYRNYRIERGECRTLAEKASEREQLRYAIEAPEIRIRLGWKPAPPTVLEQTPETEPKMKVACTFDRVCDIIDELKRQGVDKAQLCLVGWNKSGHDGRWPQMFPVEESLGGEERLRHLIGYAKKNGYRIVCHTNSTDCYSIAEGFSEDMIIRKKDGGLSVNDTPWSGGRMYHLCPRKALEIAEKNLPRVAGMGFEGLHYIDVMSIISLRWCFDERHSVNSRETLEIYEKIMKMCHDLFGGFSSEGCFDFAAKYQDYGMYVSWPAVDDDMCDEVIPLWEIVYHGIMLYNTTTDTVNCTAKGKKRELDMIESGSRPTFYFYSKFLEGSDMDDWLGNEDLTCDTDEQLCSSVAKIKEAYEMYKKLSRLQLQFITKHCQIENGVFEITYSDGAKITVDRNENTYKIC